MAERKKQNGLREQLICELQDIGTFRDIDTILIDNYVKLQIQFDALTSDIETRGVMYNDENGVERTNPSLRSLTAISSQIVSLAKQLGIGVYGRKLTVATGEKKSHSASKVASLVPRKRKAN